MTYATLADTRRGDAMDAHLAVSAYVLERTQEEIRAAFATCKPTAAVPYVDQRYPRRVRDLSMLDAVAELMQQCAGLRELMFALEHSKCPHVAAFKAAMASAYIDQNAAEVAAMRM